MLQNLIIRKEEQRQLFQKLKVLTKENLATSFVMMQGEDEPKDITGRVRMKNDRQR